MIRITIVAAGIWVGFVSVALAQVTSPNFSSSVPIPATNRAYLDGFKDARAFTLWFTSLTGESRVGAVEGELNSTTLPATLCSDEAQQGCYVVPCVKINGAGGPLWIAGCQEAENYLVPMFKREAIDPDYKRGVDAADAASTEQEQRTSGEAAFQECAKSEVSGGSYSSDDGGASIKRLISQCNAQAQAWFSNCIEQWGETDGSCAWSVTLDAASAIDDASK